MKGGKLMKRSYLILGLLVLLASALVVPAAFGATDTTDQAKAWFDQMFAAKKAWVDQLVKDGKLTQEQGKAWKDHFDQMQQFRAQNGYTCPGGGPCMGSRMGGRMGGGPWWMNNGNPPAANSQ